MRTAVKPGRPSRPPFVPLLGEQFVRDRDQVLTIARQTKTVVSLADEHAETIESLQVRHLKVDLTSAFVSPGTDATPIQRERLVLPRDDVDRLQLSASLLQRKEGVRITVAIERHEGHQLLGLRHGR